MDEESQPPPLFPDDDAVDNGEDLFAMPSAVCDFTGSLLFACCRLVGVAAGRSAFFTYSTVYRFSFWPDVQRATYVPESPVYNPKCNPTSSTLLTLTLFERLAKKFYPVPYI